MSHDQSTSERVYGQLKAAVLNGSLGDQARLDFAELALVYGVSTTPVREAAMRLQGEGLLELHAKGGARPIRLSEFRLRSLLEMHGTIVLAALSKAAAFTRRDKANAAWQAADGDEQRARAIFRAVADGASNPELNDILERLSDRLAPYRLREDRVFSDARRELDSLQAAIGDPALLRRLIRAYHRRRSARVAKLVWVAGLRSDSNSAP